MSPALRLRLRTSTGAQEIEVDPNTTFPTLRETVAAAAAVDPASLNLRAGFPPKLLDLSTKEPVSTQLSTGDVVTVQGKPISPKLPTAVSADATSVSQLSNSAAVQTESTPTTYDSITSSGNLTERIVPDDNSCMFRSVAAIVYNDPYTETAEMRRICAEAVAKDPLFYTRDLLQRPNPEYCQWIQRATSWGGPIELAILSAHFKIEIAAFDVKSMHAERYGEGQYPTVGYLVYDGLHYNYVALFLGVGVPDVTQFSSDDVIAMEKVRAIAKHRHDTGSYTDTANFRLKCMICGEILRGERAASDHGDQTGHSRFEEV